MRWARSSFRQGVSGSTPVHAHLAALEHFEEELARHRRLGAEDAGSADRAAAEQLTRDRERDSRVEAAGGDLPPGVRAARSSRRGARRGARPSSRGRPRAARRSRSASPGGTVCRAASSRRISRGESLPPTFSREANPSSTRNRTFSVNAGSKATLKLASRRPGKRAREHGDLGVERVERLGAAHGVGKLDRLPAAHRGHRGGPAVVEDHRLERELVEDRVEGVRNRQRTGGAAVDAADAHVDGVDRVEARGRGRRP